MRVVVEAPLLVSERAKASTLDMMMLFGLCMRQECHCIEIEPEGAPELQIWLGTLTLGQREEIEFLLDESAERQVREPPARTLRVADVAQPDWSSPTPRLPLGDAVDLLRKPLRVLIEGVNDETFLRSVVPQAYRGRFEAWLKQEVLKLEHRGGLENLQHVVKQECREPNRRLRLFVLFDSDARKSGKPSSQSRELARTCQRRSLAHHQLQRRAIENYIPKPALERWLRGSRSRDFDRWLPKLQALFHQRVTNEQRHHYNMKSGLQGDRNGGELADIYDGLDESIAAELESGFGGDVARAFEESIPGAWCVEDGQGPELTQLFERLLRAA